MMGLCRLCQGITLPALVSKTGYKHQQSLEALQQSAKQCALCNLFLSATLSATDPKELSCYLMKNIHQSQIDLKAYDGPFFEPDRLDRLSTLVVYVEDLGVASLSLYTEAADPAALSGVVAGRYLGLDPSSQAHLSLAAEWIKDCMRNHTECSLDSTSALPQGFLQYQTPLPTRLIDVGGPDGSRGPFLYESANELGTYVTLSHCWGKTPTLTTKTTTLRDRKNGIEFSTLSNNFRDAVTITRKLGLQYLWIDALCIIQDSSDDWQRESSRMGEVYRNSLFTISATGAKDSHRGCFQKRPAPPLEAVKIDCRLADGSGCKIYFRLQTDHSDTASFYDDGQAAPLNDRAWCLQERLLSRRTLHYGKEQMFWECHKLSLLEDGSQCEGWSWKKRGFDVMRTCNLNQLSQARADETMGAVYTDWRSTVKRYTARSLTRDTDKLPGLSGVATLIQRFTGDQYLAGIWRKDLPHELMWSSSLGSPLRRPAGYRAPSWAWASLDGNIEYTVVDMNRSSVIDIIDAHIELLGHDNHGQVKGGWIKVSGPMLFAASAHQNRTESLIADILDESGHQIGTCHFDVEESVPRPVACLFIGIPQRSSVAKDILILEATGKKQGEYRRIGTGKIKTVPDVVARMTVIIV